MPSPGEDLLRYLIIPNHHQTYASAMAAPAAPSPTPPMSTASTQHPSTPASRAVSLETYLAMNPAPSDSSNVAGKDQGQGKDKSSKTKTKASSEVNVSVSSTSSEHIKALNQLCQYLSVKWPLFESFGNHHSGWGVRIDFLGQNIEEGGCKTKAEAKSKVCERALAVLKKEQEEGRITRGTKREASSAAGGDTPTQATRTDPKVNYKGQLCEFLTSLHCPLPTFKEYSINQNAFSYEVAFSLSTDADAPLLTFGTSQPCFASKKIAQQDTCRIAIEALQERGVWPDRESYTAQGGIKKKKKQTVAQPPPPPTDDDSAHHPATGPSTTTKTPPTTTTTDPNSDTPTTTYGAQVVTLAQSLNMGPPTYVFAPVSELAPDFHIMSCVFRAGWPGLDKPVGMTSRIHGKKKAREECARLTLMWLEGVKRERLEELKRAMERAGGVKQPAAKTKIAGQDEEEEGEEKFEDTMERVG